MTAHVPMARVPFAPLDNPRLQHLASAKNRQNGVLAQQSSASPLGKISITKTSNTNKRSFEPAIFNDDGENVDPNQEVFDSPSKKTKSEAFTFSSKTSTSMPPPSRLSTPIRSNISSPRTPLTAPAGRSPKRKIASLKQSRRVSAPFSRIDPPTSGSSSLPFSLDSVLSSKGNTIQESMPKNWFFEIYQDTPEEEASNLMEHSTLTLDLGSDDEGELKDDRGKENTPPEGYDGPSASVGSGGVVAPTKIVRKKIIAADEMDDGARSPLSDLETEAFIPEGLSKDSCVIVDGEGEGQAKGLGMMDFKDLFAMPAKKEEVVDVPVVEKKEEVVEVPVVDVKAEIVVWEDA